MTLPEDYYAMQPDPVPGHETPGMEVWGWTSPAELEWLRASAALMQSVVEIGALHGRSSTALLSGCPGPVYCVDPWDDPGRHSFPSFMRSCGHFRNLRPVMGLSPAVAEGIPDVDMVFLDGAHDEASVVADIGAWLPKTRVLLCGHDYVPGGSFPDVATVVDRIFGRHVEIIADTAIWAVNVPAWLNRTTRPARKAARR
jgi:hypothetical protein